jgi:surfeit locus 1 family protein
MPIRFSARGRVFAPSWPMTLLTFVLLMVFMSLGRWQWQRGVEKQAMRAEFEHQSAATPTAAGDVDTSSRFARLTLEGRFEPGHQFLLDNRSHAGRAGYEVLTPFVLSSGRRLLVNRGWVPFTGYRDRLPDISFAADESQKITGRLDELPAAGLASGRAAPARDTSWPKLTSFPTHEELESALGAPLARHILLLDADQPQGYVREWSSPGLAPERHFSYAIQWWGFAVVLLVLYFGLNFRKVP